MKQKPALFITICFFLIAYGCSKNPTTDINTGGSSSGPGSTEVTLLGKWYVIKDSIAVKNFAFSDGTVPMPGVYYGTVNDYWNFKADSTVYIYEGGYVGTTPYQLPSSNRLLIPAMQIGELTITTLTSTNFTWEKAITNSNGGTYYRRAYFKR